MQFVLSVSAFLFEFRFYALQSINCLFRDFHMNDSYTFLFFMGITIMVFPMTLLVRLTLKLKPNFLLAAECRQARNEYNAIARKSYTGFWHEGWVKEHQTTPALMSCIQVFVFYLLQIDMYYLLSMLKCIQVGTDDMGLPIKLMNTDVRVNCDSESYKKLYAVAIACSVLFGGFSTFGFVIYMGYYRFRRFEDDFQAVWSFMFLGLKESLWFWNLIIIFRKILMILIVSFLKYQISLYCYVWIMMGWTWVEYEKKPFIDQDFNQLSTVFNIVLIVSGNVGMTFEVIDDALSEKLLDFFNVLIIVISITLFIWKCSRMFIMRYMEVRAEARKEFMEDVDEKHIEEEMAKRHKEEVEHDKRKEDEERAVLEKIQKEMRAAAAAAAGSFSKISDFDAAGIDTSSNHGGDQFANMMDNFFDASRRRDDDDERRSAVSKKTSFVKRRIPNACPEGSAALY